MAEDHAEPSQAQIQPRPNWFDAAAARPCFGDLTLLDLAICLGLLLATFAVYAQVGQFDFVNFDDTLYVADNPHVKTGLTPAGIKWAFSAVVASNWHPVTLLSLMLDVQLFGVHSEAHHLMNVVYHALAAVVLFLLLRRATRSRAPSAFVAFIFALHPLHVESVAWIAERKDVLSAFFFFLTLYAYIRYTEQPTARRYLLVAGLLALGLMSKPMVVTLAFVLLLFDFWPLRRFDFPKIVWEKLPLFALSAVASFVTYRVQRSSGAVAEVVPLDGRIANALLAYATYIRQALWPARLAVFYPQPRFILATRAAAVLIMLLGISAAVVLARRKRPYLATGWFWYLGTLVPVIGLVTIGQHSHADRYAYIPLVGLSMIPAWGAADLVAKWPRARFAVVAAAAVCCALCLTCTSKQVGYWQNSETLYLHAIEVTPDNWLAHSNLGAYLMDIPERRADAVEHLEAALRIRPGYAKAENNLGLTLAKVELCGAAIPHFEAALRSQPGLVQVHNNIAMCLTRTGQYGAAIAHLMLAQRIAPRYADAYFNLGSTLSQIAGQDRAAIAEYEAGLRVNDDPSSPAAAQAHRNLGELLMKNGRTAEAMAHLEAAQRIETDPETTQLIDRLRTGAK